MPLIMFDLQALIRPNIRDLKPYTSARDEYTGSEGVFLDANENPFGTLNRYPDPYQKKLKERIAELKGIPANQIFVGNGSDEVIDLAYRIFCTPRKDKVVTFTPTYGMYAVSAAINDVELIEVPLNEEFQLDLSSFNELIEDNAIKLLFLCSPNNPTGNTLSRRSIEKILADFRGVVMIDEAYIDFSSAESWSQEINNYPNLVVMQTFSKAWGLAAARLGVAFASKEMINIFNNVKPPYNVSKPNQDEAIRALGAVKQIEENIKIILGQRTLLVEELQKIDLVKKVYPSDANFLLVEMTDANEVYEKLIEERIIVRNRHGLVRNCLRITVGSEEENRKLILALKNFNL